MEIILLTDVYTEGWMRSAGAYKLATELRLAGYSVQVIDFTCRLTEEETLKIFKKFITKETKILGVSDTFLYDDANSIFDQEWMLPLIGEFKDRYNFNDAVDIQSVADALNAAAIIGYETGTLKLYGAVRTIGTFFGSNDQEGAFVEINLGNYDELMGN